MWLPVFLMHDSCVIHSFICMICAKHIHQATIWAWHSPYQLATPLGTQHTATRIRRTFWHLLAPLLALTCPLLQQWLPARPPTSHPAAPAQGWSHSTS
jgi:hypothetical protein